MNDSNVIQRLNKRDLDHAKANKARHLRQLREDHRNILRLERQRQILRRDGLSRGEGR